MIDTTKPKLSINELAAKRSRCKDAKAAGLPCTEFPPLEIAPLSSLQISFPKRGRCARYTQTDRGCSLHGRCYEADKVERRQARDLTGCPDFLKADDYRTGLAPDLLPGLPDPLAVPELKITPADWAKRPEVMAAHIAALQKLLASTIPPPAKAEGEGIVYCGGGPKFWPMLCVAVRMCRDQTQLPIQIWHRGADEPVYPDDLADVPNVEIIDGTQFPTRILRGWEMKSLALLNCGWERVLFLDADAILVGSPDALMSLATEEKPFVFWQDMPDHDTSVKWEMTGIPSEVGQAVECVQGGQLALNRKAMWRELVIFFWLNMHSCYFYKSGYGDQDMHRVTLAATGRNHHCLGRAPWRFPAFVCNLNGGPPLIVHRPQGKWYGTDADKRADHLPGEARAWAHRARFLAGADAATVFGNIYASGSWGHADRSGGGSTVAEAAPYLEIVNRMAQFERWDTVIDLGCGDGYVSARIEAAHVIGVDCYVKHLERLRIQHPDLEWVEMDLDVDRERLPTGDVAFLKDVMQHQTDAFIRDWIAWARTCGKWKAVVITNDRIQRHPDPPMGGYRGLSIEKEPLKSLGLVKLHDYLHKSILLLKCDVGGNVS